MKHVLQSKANKDKSTEIPVSSHCTLYCTVLVYAHVHCAMPRAKKGQQKVPIFKKTGFVPLEVTALPYTTLGYMANVQCALCNSESQKKVSKRKVPFLKKTKGQCPSRSY